MHKNTEQKKCPTSQNTSLQEQQSPFVCYLSKIGGHHL